ncbi:MAG: hypothetical protein M3Q49_05975 [Actinomycetota bacterium]|nr:hypothetical protein [Actinomycetota bacterium]
MTQTTMEMVRRGRMAKFVDYTAGGTELRLAGRRVDVLRSCGEEVGRSGYWLVTDRGDRSFGRNRVEAEAALERERVIEAVVEYLARRDRRTHPAGEFDGAGRFYLDAGERQECCDGIRSPSAAYPFSYMKHCCSVEHVARLHNADERAVRKAARALSQALAKIEGAEEAFARLSATEQRRVMRVSLRRGIGSLADLSPLRPVVFEEA